MYKGKKILGVITARGGSNGIPVKNIKELCGKPLIAYSIEAAKASKYLTRSIVSTDYEDIADVARRFGADVPFLRPTELSGDKSSSISAVQHGLGWLKEYEGEQYDYLMILQPTSPMRTAEDIDECIRLVVDTGADSVMSMYELTDFSLKKIKKIKDGIILPFFQEEGATSSMRQDLEKMYKRNCAVYLTKVSFIKEGDLFGKISRAYIMPEERSVDINQPVDFDLAEFWLARQK